MATAISSIIGAIIGGVTAIIVCIINNNKQNALIVYRLEQLEKKVDKHNNVVERMYIAEGKIEKLEDEFRKRA